MQSVRWYGENRDLFIKCPKTASVAFGLERGRVGLFHAVETATAKAQRPKVRSRCRGTL